MTLLASKQRAIRQLENVINVHSIDFSAECFLTQDISSVLAHTRKTSCFEVEERCYTNKKFNCMNENEMYCLLIKFLIKKPTPEKSTEKPFIKTSASK